MQRAKSTLLGTFEKTDKLNEIIEIVELGTKLQLVLFNIFGVIMRLRALPQTLVFGCRTLVVIFVGVGVFISGVRFLVLFFSFLALLLLLLLLRLLLLIKHLLLLVLGLRPSLLRELLSFLNIIGDEEIVKNRSGLHLPDFNANVSQWGELVHSRVVYVFRVRDDFGLPFPFIRRVLDHLRLPFAFVAWIIDQWGLPLPIILLVPVIRLLRIGISYLSRLIIPAGGFRVFRIWYLSLIDPVGGLLVVRIRNFLRRQQRKIVIETTRLDLLLINLNLISVIRLYNQRVQVRQLICLTLDVLLCHLILAFVVDNHVSFFC
mmetsp:Transcript_10163/g.17726  ORF Transcript_10163/g.17726 Transcript_10163/m.17726 type:complete len:318 (-) Transcript_10163:509-1462(-)